MPNPALEHGVSYATSYVGPARISATMWATAATLGLTAPQGPSTSISRQETHDGLAVVVMRSVRMEGHPVGSTSSTS